MSRHPRVPGSARGLPGGRGVQARPNLRFGAILERVVERSQEARAHPGAGVDVDRGVRRILELLQEQVMEDVGPTIELPVGPSQHEVSIRSNAADSVSRD